MKFTINVNGKEVTCYRVENDINGNPRYVIHFLDLGIRPEDYGKIPGLRRYRGKWFGGGYVIQSYSLEESVKYLLNHVKKWYEKGK